MKKKIRKIYKKIFSLEFYEDLLIAVLRLVLVTPYYFFKNKKYKKLFKLETYENGLISMLKFFIRRSPLKLINRKYAKHHPYQSAGTSFVTILGIFGLAGWFVFTSYYSSASAWWNDDWLYRKQLTINSSQVTADLTNFPILVSITDGDLASKAQTDGDDIVFTLNQGNQLDHEIESFDATTGALTAWVKIPELDGDQDSLLYMYYGNPTTDNQQKPEEVWDENFVMVQHMEESGTGTRSDSTRNNNDGITSSFEGDEGIDTGQVNGADEFDGSAEWIQMNQSNSLDNITGDQVTLSAWALATADQNDDAGIIVKSDQTGGNIYNYQLVWNGVERPDFRVRTTSGLNLAESAEFLSQDTWYYLVGIYDGANAIMYVDTINEASDNKTGNILETSEPAVIGRRALDDHRFFEGIIDEVRVSKVARSTDWMTTEFNNQDDPSAFLSVASEEKGPSPVLYLPLDEGFGTTAHDETSAHNDATISGATWADEDMCKTGRCLQFDGDDYLEIDDDDTLDLTNEMTMEVWVKPTSTDRSNQTIISKQESPDGPTKIYRSVGPSATSAITTGSSNEMTITGTTAQFASALPTNVGVGDAIQYDDDGDGDIDGDDSIAFIKERVSSKEFKLQTSTGGVPTAVDKDTDWSLFRAYISLANWESGTENTGIDDDLETFDAGNRDIATNNEQWNVACYANGTTADSTNVTIDSWTTDEDNYIKIYTPTEASEVGTTQRHSGVWDTNKYKLITSSGTSLSIQDDDVTIEGLQAEAGTAGHVIAGNSLGTGVFYIGYNILRGGDSGIDVGGGGTSPDTYLYNNIVYDFADKNSLNYSNHYVYNCVFKSTNAAGTIGLRAYGGTTTIINSASFNNVDDFAVGSGGTQNISYSATDDGDGSNSVQPSDWTAVFEDHVNDDFRLKSTDTDLIAAGTDLSADADLAFNQDIESDERNFNDTWDIGADEYRPTEIYRSVGPGSTDALEEGTDNPMTIVGDIATFSSALADNIGVGDAIQYDDDGDGDIDSSDSIVFIKERISNYEYKTQTSTGGLPVEVESDTDWSLFRAYISLSLAETGTENTGIDSDLRNFDSWTGGRDLEGNDEEWNIACYADATDTTAVDIEGWDPVVNNKLRIYTPYLESEVGESQRHEGVWDVNKYILETGTGNETLYVDNNFVVIDGLQLTNSGSASSDEVILVYNYKVNTTIRNNIIKGGYEGIETSGVGASVGNFLVYNNIVYGTYQNGMWITATAGNPSYVFNNTVYGCNTGNQNYGDGINGSSNVYVYNNISMGNYYGGLGTNDFDVSNQDYNISDDSSASGAGSLTNRTATASSSPGAGDWVVFQNITSGSEDLHLQTISENDALEAGTDLSSDPNLAFSTDIDDDKREGNWSIGADEGTPTKIYRSVGPSNTTALATGADNDLTISGSTATFDEPLPDRIGVGDAIQYDDDSDGDIDANDSIVFIHGRTSSTEYTVKTADGSAPVAVTNDNDWSVFRAYTSLYDAERGDENDGIDDDLESFESWSDGKNLVTAGEQWNVACYADAVDTTAASISGWTTSEDNYIRLYSPSDIIEVGESQKHEGAWNSSKYSLVISGDSSLVLGTGHINVDGLQIGQGGSDWGIDARYVGDSVYNISNNIIRDMTGGAGYGAYIWDDQIDVNMWNNIVYGGWYRGFYITGVSSASVYSNTIFDIDDTCMSSSAGIVVAKNNITQDCLNGYSSNFHSDSDFNISDDTSAPGSHSKESTNVTFRDESGDDFRLAMDDTAAKSAGVNLFTNDDLRVTNDIEGEARPVAPTAFDIGADQISTAIHDNYSMSLFNDSAKITNSEETFATFEEDIPANRWTHIAYARDSVDQWLYINGTEKETSTIENFLFDNNGKLYIGSQDDNSNNSFQGFLDEIRIYNYARDEREIRADRAAGSSGRAAQRAQGGIAAAIGGSDNFMSDGLVAYYKMDETSGTTYADSSGNNNHGTLTDAQETGTAETASSTTTIVDADNTDLSTTDDAYNGMIVEITGGSCGITVGTTQTISDYTGATRTITVPSAFSAETDACTFLVDHQIGGKFGSNVSFDEINDHIVVGNPEVLDITGNELSMVAWVKFDDNPTTSMGIMAKTASSGGYRLMIGGNRKPYIQLRGTTDPYIEGDTVLNASTWYHITGTFDGEKLVIFVNGDKDGEIDFQGNVSTTTAEFWIGHGDDSTGESFSYPFDGDIDEARVYNRALDAREVKELYEWAPGPVAHWKMDEKVAGDAQTLYDISGNENHGTTSDGGNDTGMDCSKPGKYGFGCEFDGIDDAASATDSDSLDIGVSDLTISTWAKMGSASDHKIVIKKGANGPTGDPGYNFYYNNSASAMTFGVSDGNRTPVSSNSLSIEDDQWHHLAVSADRSGDATFYVDGVSSGSGDISSSSGNASSSVNFLIGQWGGVYYWDGSMDDLKVYNYARTQDQIIEDMNAGHPAGGSPVGSPVAYWKFNEGFGDTAYDELGNNDGTLEASTGGTNLTETAMWDLNGKYGKAIEFDGTDDYTQVPYNSVFDLDELTVSLWFNVDTQDATPQVLFQKALANDNDGYWIMLATNSTISLPIASGGAIEYLNTTKTISDDTWYHVVASYSDSNSESKIYIDGKQEGIDTSATMTNAASQPIYIGAEDGNLYEFDGLIDEVKIYNYAMTDDQVTTEYNRGKSVVFGSSGTDSSGNPVRGASGKYCVPGDTTSCDPPVLDLNFDEMSGTTAYDLSGNGNDGTLTNGPVWNPVGKFGSAITFDGTDDYVDVGSDNSVDDIFSGGGTISTWLYPVGWGEGDRGRIIDKSNSSIAGDGYRFAVEDTGFISYRRNFSTNDGEWTTPVSSVSLNEWQHVSITYDEDSTSNDPQVYINGISQNLTESRIPDGSADSDSNTNLRVGNYSTDYTFNGILDHVQVFDYARTPAQIAWDFNKGKPIGHWKMNKGSGVTVFDESGNGNDGTMTNMDAGTDWVDGKFGGALDFDGSDDVVRITDDTVLDYSEMSGLTVSLWARPDVSTITQGDEMTVFAQYQTWRPIYFHVDHPSDKWYFCINNCDGGGALAPDTINVGQWVHLTGVWKSSSYVKLYINGIEVASDTSAIVSSPGDESVDNGIGARIFSSSEDEFFDGQIDEVKIFNYPLTAEQVKGIYTSGAVSFR